MRTTLTLKQKDKTVMFRGSSAPEPLELLPQVELFQGLNSAQVAELVELIQYHQFNSGDVIFRQDSVGDQIYVIANGQVEIRIQDGNQTGYAAVYLGSGQVFGEMALIDQGPRSATVIAAEDGTQVYGFPIEAFNALCQRNTAIGYVLMRNLAQDLSFKLRHRHFDFPEAQE